ncbi:MAG TPA: SDR family NAD(P)-dependent oxidoreductase, partial [Candidatus Synoicihabitans sp.]|nr:SDR family NAD(P)-dependent oxidoreductase [Candidatus Synoicihabitans sp.]
FHWAGRDALSRHELGTRLRAHFGLTEAQAPIVRVQRSDNPDAVRTRPADLRLDLRPLRERMTTQPESFDEQLRQLRVPAACRDWIKLP